MMRRKKISGILLSILLWGGLPSEQTVALHLPQEMQSFFQNAADASSHAEALSALGVVNEKGEPIQTVGEDFSVTFGKNMLTLDGVNPNQTFYIYFGSAANHNDKIFLRDGQTDDLTGRVASPADLFDERLFRFRYHLLGEAADALFEITPVEGKSIGKRLLGDWLKILLRDDISNQDRAVVIDCTFQAKRDADYDKIPTNSAFADYKTGDYTTFRLKLWIRNTPVSDGDNISLKQSAVYEGVVSGENELTWGEDKARFRFRSDSSGEPFYARLTTSTDWEFYVNAAAPADADVWFYDFVSNPSVSAVTAGTLTLGLPWSREHPFPPDPQFCSIYRRLPGGLYEDVTSEFTFDKNFPGWTTKTFTLGSYCISDKALTGDSVVNAAPESAPAVAAPPENILPDTIKLPESTGFFVFCSLCFDVSLTSGAPSTAQSKS